MSPADRALLIEQLIDHEGLRLRPYTDTVGKLTIGVGRNLIDKGISKATTYQMLDEDLDEAITDLSSYAWFVTLDPVRQRALVDLRFNLGPGKFRRFVKLLAAMEAGHFATAAEELTASAWATQVQPRRRLRLVNMLRTGADT